MTTLVIERESPERRRHRLLGGWRDVLDDIRALCRSLDELPDECQCGHGTAHLNGTCSCCHQVAIERVPRCDDCEEQLARLRSRIDALTVDTFRFLPVVREILNRTTPDVARRESGIEWRIAELTRTFADLVVAADRFKSDCRTSHMKTLKEAASTLRQDAEALNHLV